MQLTVCEKGCVCVGGGGGGMGRALVLHPSMAWA